MCEMMREGERKREKEKKRREKEKVWGPEAEMDCGELKRRKTNQTSLTILLNSLSLTPSLSLSLFRSLSPSCLVSPSNSLAWCLSLLLGLSLSLFFTLCVSLQSQGWSMFTDTPVVDHESFIRLIVQHTAGYSIQLLTINIFKVEFEL